jgi:ABC-type Fe3+ transport system permease subunit
MHSVRFLAIAIGGIESGYNRIHGVFDDAAQNLGRNQFLILKEFIFHYSALQSSLLHYLFLWIV